VSTVTSVSKHLRHHTCPRLNYAIPRILDCVLFFVAKRPVTIITMDRNFSVMTLAQGALGISKEDAWSN